MGRLQAEEMRAMLAEEQALRWHLQYNHYPPISPDFIPVAKKAIELAREDKWEEVIEMPNGLSRTVSQIIEGMHLETFLEEEYVIEDEDTERDKKQQDEETGLSLI